MPRYYIKLDAPFPLDDTEGELYADDEHARCDALSFLADLLKDRCREIGSLEGWSVRVYDEASALVCQFDFNTQYFTAEERAWEAIDAKPLSAFCN